MGNDAFGSSPLARGLPCVEHIEVPRPGIIPARAGFTGLTAPPLAPRWGSSPLARGLLTLEKLSRFLGGIIPARAGFTYVYVSKLGSMQDHPRSRGVYNHSLLRL